MEKKLCLLFLVVNIHLTSSVSHSLQYLHTAVTRDIFTEVSSVGLVDGYQTNYDDIKKKIPNTGPETQTLQDHQDKFKHDAISLMEHLNQTEGVYTMQLMYSCELNDDGTTRGYMQFGYDGEDFLILDLNNLTWTAANDKADVIVQERNCDACAGHVKDYLENECIECLKQFVKYGRETLERKVPPEVSLFQKDSSSPVVCHATGFFPKSVMIYWKKNGEDLYEDVDLRETLPNQDGTFQKRSILTVSREELDNNKYTCIVQHSSLEKEMVLQVSDRRVLSGGGSVGIITGAVVVAVLLLIIIACVGVSICYKKKMMSGFKPVSGKPGANSDGDTISHLSKDLPNNF